VPAGRRAVVLSCRRAVGLALVGVVEHRGTALLGLALVGVVEHRGTALLGLQSLRRALVTRDRPGYRDRWLRMRCGCCFHAALAQCRFGLFGVGEHRVAREALQ